MSAGLCAALDTAALSTAFASFDVSAVSFSAQAALTSLCNEWRKSALVPFCNVAAGKVIDFNPFCNFVAGKVINFGPF